MYKQNKTLDFMKCLACIGVVFIHTQFPTYFGQIINALSRAGVALFFIISGYYSYYSDKEVAINKLKTRFKRNLKITIYAFAFYLLWGIFVRLIGTGISSVKEWLTGFNVKNIINLIVFNEDIIIGHLWFLLALLYCYIIMIIIEKYNLKNIAYFLMFPIITVGILFMAYCSISKNGISMIYFRNTWIYGMPIFLIGNWIHKNKNKILNMINKKQTILILFLSIIMTLIERIYIGNLQLFLGSIIMTIMILIFSLHYPNLNRFEICSIIGNKYSLDIYIYHWMIMDIFDKIYRTLNFEGVLIIQWLNPLLVLFTCLIFAVMLEKLKKS